MASELSDQIMKEIEQYKGKYGKKWGMHYFNNFDNHLVEGRWRILPKDATDKDREIQKAFMLMPVVGNPGSSDRMMGLTYGKFYKEVDSIVAGLGINEIGIIEKRNRLKLNDDWSLFDLLIPVYIKLRERGYNHYPDLTA